MTAGDGVSLDGGLRGSPEGVTTGQPRAGRGATGELGTGLQGGAPHGGRRVSPGYVYTGESVRGGVPMRIDHRPHGRLRNVRAGGVRRDDRRGPRHPTITMSDPPFWSFVILFKWSNLRP